MRIFRTKAVSRFFKSERVDDRQLIETAAELERRLIGADLGGGLFKQRIARAGQGKRGSYRVLIGFRARKRTVFLFGFAKNEMDNIDNRQLTTLREIAAAWLTASDTKVARALAEGILIEVLHEDED